MPKLDQVAAEPKDEPEELGRDGEEEYEQDAEPDEQVPDEEQNPYGDMGEADEGLDEDEMIDVAEKIFLLMAEKMVENKIQNVRDVFEPYLFEADIDGDIYELLSPYDLLHGIKDLGIDDLQKLEITYLMKVLSKPELEGNILLIELQQIMDNIVLTD
jgi:hypothetical protein